MLLSRTISHGRARIDWRNWRGCGSCLNRQYSNATSRASNKFLKISEEVQDAVATGKPVVALETTIYTHGFPYPDNVALAKRLESIVRENGGVPATIGVLNGIARVGMNAAELTELTSASLQKNVLKVSRRDLGYICGVGLTGKRMHGGTTIAGTMVLAQLAGIKVFATGGLGGVHRGGETSMDISADLTELGRTPVSVITSGCKSFLDIRRTLEVLETQGVVVATFADGREGPIDFPAFFTRDSGITSPRVVQDEADAAAIIYAQSTLQLSSGILFTNPVPEEHSFSKPEMDAIIAKAIELSHLEGVHGSDNTPYILAKIKELSDGRSVETNRALVECNVKRGTRVAVELSKLESGRTTDGSRYIPILNGNNQISTEPVAGLRSSEESSVSSCSVLASERVENKIDVLVAGSLAVDLACDFIPSNASDCDKTPALHTSNPSIISQSLGGVGYNVALASSYMGTSVLFCSVIANDISGRSAQVALSEANKNLRSDGVKELTAAEDIRTAKYIAVNDSNKELVLAMADMSILELPEEKLKFDEFWDPLIQRAKPTWAVVDCNWSPQVISKWISICNTHGVKIAIEPVSSAKAARLFSRIKGKNNDLPNNLLCKSSSERHLIDIITPNRYELAYMHTTARDAGLFDSPEWWNTINSLSLPSTGSRDRFISVTSASIVDEGIPQQSIQLLPFIPCIVTKLGKQGVLLTQLLRERDPRLADVEYAPYILSRAVNEDNTNTGSRRVGGIYMRLFPPAEEVTEQNVVSVNGAGDTLLGVLVSALAMGEKSGKPEKTWLERIIPVAQQASVKTLKSKGGISPDIQILKPSLETL
ncbi:hypothetical protein LOY97_000814 [Ophidiomyces ophidiicola]|nr:hypothetical protein LOZ49_000157 [Ophidiomyces ophidiicola]KAI2142108.1 hypothetical protein LOZ29_001599 [Ophidiomyces ophidiicola]KAI2144568.1 hypothetical protein LOZ28_001390 [Ophidiomyces ophidiicola]KAI2221126.1 hypothetical protein LOZ15_001987 [Ophidiomyces ophidiicola]KAI2441856.1 hypothetical protein LOZ08_003297 [Ophidiomyces ophidiicola]